MVDVHLPYGLLIAIFPHRTLLFLRKVGNLKEKQRRPATDKGFQQPDLIKKGRKKVG